MTRKIIGTAIFLSALAGPAMAQTSGMEGPPQQPVTEISQPVGAERFDEWMAMVAAPRTNKGGGINDGELWVVRTQGQHNGRPAQITVVANTPIPDTEEAERLWPGEANLWQKDAAARERQ